MDSQHLDLFDYINAKDKELWAFNYFLNCTNEQITNFIDYLSEDRKAVDPSFIWAAEAIESMAED